MEQKTAALFILEKGLDNVFVTRVTKPSAGYLQSKCKWAKDVPALTKVTDLL